MNIRVKKLLKSFLFIFIINILISPFCFAAGTKAPAILQTICKAIIAVAQIFVSGWFVIRMTLIGISYFSGVATSNDKAKGKQQLAFTLFCGIVAFLGMYLFSKAVGL